MEKDLTITNAKLDPNRSTNVLKKGQSILDENGKFTILVETFFTCVKMGMGNPQACAKSGLRDANFYSWIKLGEQDDINMLDTPECQFYLAYKKAKSDCQMFHLQNITKASQKDWKASAWVLERVFRDDFGSQQKENASENITIVYGGVQKHINDTKAIEQDKIVENNIENDNK